MPKLGTTEKRNDGRAMPTQVTPAKLVSATKAGSVLTLTFDQPVCLIRGNVPQYSVDVADTSPVSAISPTIDTVEVTYSAAIDAATEVTIPYVDPAVRTKDGGFVCNSTFPVAA
jgi:hypothetical protein